VSSLRRGRAASNSAEGDDVVEREHVIEGIPRSRKPRIAAELGAGTAKPADIDEARYSL
jgi:hypothetical protein